jgi:predicted alpha/beta-fold hydrolase
MNHTFTPHFFSNPIAQSLMYYFWIPAPRINFVRKVIKFEDNTDCCLDVIKNDEFINAPTVVIFPGLGGNYKSINVRHMASECITQNLNVVVYNRRAHVAESISKRIPLHYDPSDNRRVFDYLQTEFGKSPLYGVGFSAGANVLLRYAGEAGDECIFDKVVSVSNGFDYNIGTKHMSCFANLVIIQFYTDILKNVRIQHKPLFSFSFAPFIATWGNFRRLEHSLIGEKTCMDSYYDYVSCIRNINKIKRPCTLINAVDDPIFSHHVEFYKELANNNKHITQILTKQGGHMAFITGTLFHPRMWLYNEIIVQLGIKKQ